MAEQRYLNLTTFKGINRALSKRLDPNYFNAMSNLDSNIIEGALVSRKGSTVKQSSGSTPNIDKFVMFRDEEWGKDVLLVYDKDSTAANRKIYVYTRTINTDDSFAPHTTASYSYGSLRFGDRLSFLVHRNTVRIGTGTAATNKAMFGGYINRAVGSNHGAMFNDAVAFADFFLLKQQWVQQSSLVNHGKIVYDSTREKYYVLSMSGLEVRDSDFHIERILNDVVATRVGIGSTSIYHGGLAISGNSLYVVGRIPGTSDDYKLVLYDLSDDLTVDASSTLTSKFVFGVTTNGTLVWVSEWDGADGHIIEYSADLASNATRYTGSGDRLLGITYDSTYVYCCDYTNSTIVRMLIAAPYTADTLSTAANPIDVAHYNGNLYFIRTTVTYSTPTSGFPTTITTKYTDTNQTNEFISFVGAIPYLSQRSGRVVYFDGITNFNVAGYIPTKIAIGSTSSVSTSDTYFYALSVVDIYGQESHLHSGCTVQGSANNANVNLLISVNVNSENFAEMTSPSSDPDEELSVWNEFRRIKKIRVYRAYNEDSHAAEPTTSYNFLREIDINDSSWVEVTANSLYTFAFWDGTAQAEISTITYEESSGLPETFKPYYTNWQYGTQFESRYYYGNLRTDEANAHQIIQTPIDAPDVVYQHDENIDYFYTKDGDEIKGFATVWNRMVVFKSDNVAIYNELTKENVYSIGLSAPNSILAHNNVVYFVYGTGIWALTPSGYERISEPVDEILATESSLTGISGVYFKEKQKLWWLIPSGNSYCFNINKQTWDMYDIQTGNRDVIYIGQGLSDTIYTADQYDDKIYKENSGDTDAGANMTVSFTSNDIPVGGEYVNSTFTRLHLTASSSGDTVPITVLWRNENGSNSVTKTFSLSGGGDLATRKMFLSGAYGQHVRFMLSKAITKQLQIHSVGVEYYQQGKINNAN